MADNVLSNSGDGLGPRWLTSETTFGGDTGHAPLVVNGIITGAEGARTFTLHSGGAGAVDGGTGRMTLASDDPAVAHLAILNTAFNGMQALAHDAADAGDPLKIGAKAIASLSGVTAVAAADRSDLYSGLDGVLLVRGHTNLEDIVSGNASNTDGSSTQVIAAAGAGVKQYLTRVTLTNTSATMTYVELKSGTTVKHTVPVPATGGATVAFDPPLPPNAANEAWNFDPAAATTTLICSMVGFKSKL